MPLDPQVEKLLQSLAKLETPPLHTLDIIKAREVAQKTTIPEVDSVKIIPDAVVNIENRKIPGLLTEIPIRIYTPLGNSPFPILVFFHGGGWVMGSIDAADNICRTLANKAGCIVVSVEYRLAPEHKFPAAIEDAYTATKWVADNAANINGDRNLIAIGGDSAGGNIAAAVTLMARDRGFPNIIYQLLFYPATNYAFDTNSYQQYGQNYPLTTELMMCYWNHYLPNPEVGNNPYASPLLATNLSNLPPALIITAEFDPLRDDGELYAHRLKEAGVSVKLIRYDGMIHAFVGLADLLDKGKQALNDAETQLRAVFWSNTKTR